MKYDVLCFPPSNYGKKKLDKPSLSQEEIKNIVAGTCFDHLPKSIFGYLFFGWALRRIFLKLAPKVAENIVVAQRNKAQEWAEQSQTEVFAAQAAWEEENRQDKASHEEYLADNLLKQVLEEESQ